MLTIPVEIVSMLTIPVEIVSMLAIPASPLPGPPRRAPT
jgi:hypothetical protein